MTKFEASERADFAVIVPAYNATDTLSDCIQAILGATRKPHEVIVFHDGLTNGIEQIASLPTVKVISHSGPPVGPAKGRNAAARQTGCETLVFVDADVLVARDAFQILLAELAGDRRILAAFGSYDQNPRITRRAALYANLRHHWVHQNGEREAGTFWTGLGAVRARAFWSIGGFDERAGVEDIDLGTRLLRAGGRIRLVPEALGTHCKDWSVLLLWRTDVFRRAIPWAKHVASGDGIAGHLNGSARERLSAVLAYLTVSAAAGCFLSNWCAVALAIFATSYIYLNFGLFRLLLRRGGISSMLCGIVLHLIYHIYASAVYVSVTVGMHLRSSMRRIMHVTYLSRN
jgi:GT2 family glycosyltransferase